MSLVFAISLLVIDYYKTRENFPPQTYIGQVEVSGLSKEAAIIKLKEAPLSKLFYPSVAFVNEAESFIFSPEEVGILLDVQKTISQAFDITHQEHYLRELRKRLERDFVVCPIVLSLNERQAREVLYDLAKLVYSTPIDASLALDEATGAYNIVPDRKGRKLNQKETLNVFKARLKKNERIYPLSIDVYAEAEVTKEMLRKNPPVYRLSAYTTYYGKHDSVNRIHNIKLIASWINNTLLLPSEVFSLTELIGDFSVEKGFKEAFVIVGNELVPELGGGTCQIGTTLFNAVSLADLKVRSRRNHSFYFNIYPLGRDATIYPGQSDFRFENDTPYPILIKAQATSRKLSFRIYGTPSGKTVKFSTPSIYLLDKEGVYHTATLKEVFRADRPFRTVIERKVFGPKGKVLKSEVIRSYYKMHGDKTNVPIRRPEAR